jgi:putative DNA primase/helicase
MRNHRQRAARLNRNNELGIEVYAWVRTTSSTNWRRVLKFTDSDGQRRTVLVAAAQIRTTTTLCDFLEDNGFSVPAAKDARRRLKQAVLAAEPTRRAMLVERAGWHGSEFLLGVETLGRGPEELMVLGSPASHAALLQRAGTLADWKAGVANDCETSSTLVLALCLAFAVPLVRLAEINGCCIHFWGQSADSLSLIPLVAATVFGRGQGEGAYMRSWVQSATATGHSDLPVILTDVSRLDVNPVAAGQRANDIADSIVGGARTGCRGCPKRSFADTVGQAPVLIISSGEFSLAKHARADGSRRYRGEDARVIDIPILSRHSGLFDRLVSPPGEDAPDLGERLRASSLRAYGTAGRAFLDRIVQAVGVDEAKFKARLQRRIKRFYEKACIDDGDGYEVQFAKPFALAYAAGSLAIDYDILPWTPDLLRRAIRRCYWRALDRRRGPVETVRNAADAVLRRLHRSHEIIDMKNHPYPVDPKFAEQSKVLLLAHTDGSPLLAVRPEYFRKLVGAVVSAQDVARELERRGVLIPRSNGRRTRQLRIPGGEVRRDYYCLRGDSFEADASDLA